jgi:hypothetical protein
MLYISNYATLHVKDLLARLPGVGDVQIIGGRCRGGDDPCQQRERSRPAEGEKRRPTARPKRVLRVPGRPSLADFDLLGQKLQSLEPK